MSEAGLHPGYRAARATPNQPWHTAALLLDTLDGLIPADSGGFFDLADNALPW
ncbi:hypothetical protein [Thiohalospira sp.]|uniref:hypothetical protein n=1 Tax=Thiohalospira sp. TaxID=3080549 RepID=UPI0039806E77